MTSPMILVKRGGKTRIVSQLSSFELSLGSELTIKKSSERPKHADLILNTLYNNVKHVDKSALCGMDKRR